MTLRKAVITTATIGFVVLVGVAAFFRRPTVSQPTQAKKISVVDGGWNQTPEEMTATVLRAYTDIHVAGLQAFNDPGLMDFYGKDLQKACPFYVPDGVDYRACVVGLLQKEKSRLAGQPAVIKSSDTYCGQGAAKTAEGGTNGYADIHNTCLLYVLRKAH